LVEDVAQTAIAHENIRGGDYYDRCESEVISEEDDIEARYLEEERQSIIHDSEVKPEPLAPTARREGEVAQGASTATVAAVENLARDMPRTSASMALPEMLHRLQALWAKPAMLPPARHETGTRRGPEHAAPVDAHDACTSPIEVCERGRVEVGQEWSDEERMGRVCECASNEDTRCRGEV
jgi:hypothetical protein